MLSLQNYKLCPLDNILQPQALIFPHLKPGYSLNFAKLSKEEDPDSLILSNNVEILNSSFENKITLFDYVWDNLIYRKNFSTPEKRAALEEEINRLLGLISDFTVKKNYKNFFREKFFQEFKFSGKKIQNNEKKENFNNGFAWARKNHAC